MTTSTFFDDLSRSWQQQPLASAGTASAWQNLGANSSRSPIAQMQRHVWTELIFGTLIAVPLIVGLFRMPGSFAQGTAAALTGLSALSLLYYCHQLRLLRQLQRTTDPVRNHTAGHLRQLRGLLRLGLHANLGLTVALAALLLYGAVHYVLPTLPAATTYRFLLWFGLTVAASLALVHWFTKLHIREAYGQHLDRLEAALQELGTEQ